MAGRESCSSLLCLTPVADANRDLPERAQLRVAIHRPSPHPPWWCCLAQAEWWQRPCVSQTSPAQCQNDRDSNAFPSMSTALYRWRAAVRRSWRPLVVLALLGGVLGAVALAAVAGAWRTDTAYGRYLRAANVSDAFVNVPGEAAGDARYPAAHADLSPARGHGQRPVPGPDRGAGDSRPHPLVVPGRQPERDAEPRVVPAGPAHRAGRAAGSGGFRARRDDHASHQPAARRARRRHDYLRVLPHRHQLASRPARR